MQVSRDQQFSPSEQLPMQQYFTFTPGKHGAAVIAPVHMSHDLRFCNGCLYVQVCRCHSSGPLPYFSCCCGSLQLPCRLPAADSHDQTCASPCCRPDPRLLFDRAMRSPYLCVVRRGGELHSIAMVNWGAMQSLAQAMLLLPHQQLFCVVDYPPGVFMVSAPGVRAISARACDGWGTTSIAARCAGTACSQVQRACQGGSPDGAQRCARGLCPGRG